MQQAVIIWKQYRSFSHVSADDDNYPIFRLSESASFKNTYIHRYICRYIVFSAYIRIYIYRYMCINKYIYIYNVISAVRLTAA